MIEGAWSTQSPESSHERSHEALRIELPSNSTLGTPITMSECLEMVKANLTDVSPTTVEYPSIHESIKTFPIAFESKMMITSAYQFIDWLNDRSSSM